MNRPSPIPTRMTAGWVTVIACLAVLGSATSSTLGGDHWQGGGRPSVRANSGETMADGSFRQRQHPTGRSPIDIVISVHGAPRDEGTDDAYERIIEYFADVVFEATNGVHKIGQVRIFSHFQSAHRADIVWGESGPPGANANGLGIRGQHIYMFDQFNDLFFLSNDLSAEKGGLVLAHNWAHYAYGLFDEHAGSIPTSDDPATPLSRDVAVMPSIMTDPFRGADHSDSDRYQWMNFSIAYESPPGPFSNTKQTAQHRMHGRSGWETLIRPAANDPRDGILLARTRRITWGDLATAAPNPVDRWQRDLPDADARSDLEIIWMGSNLVYVFVLDRSGSMASNDKLSNAKTAVGWLVDRLETGTAIGVVQYDNAVEVLQPVINIESDSDRTPIIEKIASITARGSSAMGDAARVGLAEIMRFHSPATTRVVVLLTDGLHNTGVHPREIVPLYQDAGIPLMTIGYGQDADEDLLRELADATGGSYFFSPTTLAGVTNVFSDAIQEASRGVDITSGWVTVAWGETFTREFNVDSTLADLGVVISIATASDEVDARLLSPAGNEVRPRETIESGSSTQLRFNISTPQRGQWMLEIESLGSRPFDAGYIVDAAPAEEITYDIAVTNLTGGVVRYPDPIVLLAAVAKENPVIRAHVAATVETPNGDTVDLLFNDDGVAPDAVADDGLYSAVYAYETNGAHRIVVRMDNVARTARLTNRGLAIVDEHGQFPEPPPDKPLSEPLQRSMVVRVDTTEVSLDDHGDSLADATLIPNNNIDTPGRIETAGDVDVFRVTPASGSTQIYIRISDMSNDMEASLQIMAADGRTDRGSAESPAGPGATRPVVVNAPARSGEPVYAVVTHRDELGVGTYTISAGAEIPSDLPDGDNDGVIDDLDDCPNTPLEERVGANGCGVLEADLDGDDVPNIFDACPDTPPGVTVNSFGCPADESDADNDQVPDDMDRCLGTPGGQGVDADGCSEQQMGDDDEDGVPNYRDRCPDNAPNEIVNGIGCKCDELDEDADGVDNCSDFCPDTLPQRTANENGCSCDQLDEDGDGVDNCSDNCRGTPLGLPVDAAGCPTGEPTATSPVADSNQPSTCGMTGLTPGIILLTLFGACFFPRRQ